MPKANAPTRDDEHEDGVATRSRAALANAAAGELLCAADLRAIFHISVATFTRRRAEFEAFKARPAIGAHCYSGVLVHRCVTGQPMYEPTFGRKPKARKVV